MYLLSGVDSGTSCVMHGYTMNFTYVGKLTAGELLLRYWEYVDSGSKSYNLRPCTRENLSNGFKEINRIDLADKLTKMRVDDGAILLSC